MSLAGNSKKKRILVTGIYRSIGNGDGVICECVAALLKKEFPDAEVVLHDLFGKTEFEGIRYHEMKISADDSRVPGAEEDTEALLRATRKDMDRAKARAFATRTGLIDKEYKHITKKLARNRVNVEKIAKEHFDLVVFAGGQMLMNEFAPVVADYITEFEKTNVPVIIQAVGLGPVYSKRVKEMSGRALMLSNVKSISVRDSLGKISEVFGVPENRLVKTYDTAVWTADVYNPVKIPDSTYGQGLIGLGMMFPTNISFSGATKFWLEILKKLEEEKVEWQIFVNGSPRDMAYAVYVMEEALKRGIIKSLSGRISGADEEPASSSGIDAPTDYLTSGDLTSSLRNRYLHKRPREPKELVQEISEYRAIISQRLHSHIIAASLGIPSVAIYWDDKVTEFFGDLGHPERCYTIKSGADEIYAALTKAVDEGVDMSVIEKMKDHSRRTLLSGIEPLELK